MSDSLKPLWQSLLDKRREDRKKSKLLLDHYPHEEMALGLTEVVKELLNEKRGTFVYRIFTELTGSLTASAMLAQAVYWSDKTDNKEGWFYKTREQWDIELGIGRAEQEHARKILSTMPFWYEKLKGIPAKLHYRVDMPVLLEALTVLVQLKREKST